MVKCWYSENLSEEYVEILCTCFPIVLVKIKSLKRKSKQNLYELCSKCVKLISQNLMFHILCCFGASLLALQDVRMQRCLWKDGGHQAWVE